MLAKGNFFLKPKSFRNFAPSFLPSWNPVLKSTSFQNPLTKRFISLHEYQSQSLMKDYGIKVPPGFFFYKQTFPFFKKKLKLNQKKFHCSYSK